MPRRAATRKKSRFILSPPAPIPHNACWIESDSYDRTVYRKLRDASSSLQTLEDTGSTLVPQFGALLQDLFCALFKYNVLFLEAGRGAAQRHAEQDPARRPAPR